MFLQQGVSLCNRVRTLLLYSLSHLLVAGYGTSRIAQHRCGRAQTGIVPDLTGLHKTCQVFEVEHGTWDVPPTTTSPTSFSQ